MKKALARVTSLFLCLREKGSDVDDVTSVPVKKLRLNFDGIQDDRHRGLTCYAGERQEDYALSNSLITNLRQVSIVSEEELAQIAQKLGVPSVLGSDVGANIVLSGVPTLTSFPAGVNGVLRFPSGAFLYCMGENEPCKGPGRVLAARYNNPDLVSAFPKAAMHRRGIVALVGAYNVIHDGDVIDLMYPAWSDWTPQ